MHFLAFLGLSFIQLMELQEAVLSRPDWIIELLFPVSSFDREISSTSFPMVTSGWEVFKLLTITRNNIRPSLVPWGTPAVAGNQFESPSPTHCHRLVRKFMIHGIHVRDLRTPRSMGFSTKMLYPMQSKALEKSKKQSGDGFPYSIMNKPW